MGRKVKPQAPGRLALDLGDLKAIRERTRLEDAAGELEDDKSPAPALPPMRSGPEKPSPPPGMKKAEPKPAPPAGNARRHIRMRTRKSLILSPPKPLVARDPD